MFDESLEFRFLLWSMNVINNLYSFLIFVTHRNVFIFMFTCQDLDKKKLGSWFIHESDIDLNLDIRVQLYSFDSPSKILWYDFSWLHSMICSLFIFMIGRNSVMKNFNRITCFCKSWGKNLKYISKNFEIFEKMSVFETWIINDVSFFEIQWINLWKNYYTVSAVL